MDDLRVSMFTRFPHPGAAKTRLIPAFGAARAAAIHRRLVEHTLAMLRQCKLPFEMRITGASAAEFAAWLGPDVDYVEQGDGDLGARLARVRTPALLIGSDAPGLTVAHLNQAVAALARAPAVIGPALDGGYYLLGIARPAPFVFSDMPWGSADVAAETLRRFAAHAWPVQLLDALADVDRPEDVAAWAGLLA